VPVQRTGFSLPRAACRASRGASLSPTPRGGRSLSLRSSVFESRAARL